ncbi:hypothetical protein [Vreelandella massiliensis]|uniref:hypothetical protein n=1 Tax=Vreelandella massiliensis TaxID=1816686 RepID=UPI00118181CF|nr:hypothetical protein [Halomonas massiliensis]
MKATSMPIHPQKAAELLRDIASKIDASKPAYEDSNRPKAHPDVLISSLTDLADRIAQDHTKPFVSTFDWPFQVESAVLLLDKASEATSRGCGFAFDILFMAASELTLDLIRCAAYDCGLDACHYDDNETSPQKLKVIK